MRHTDVIIRLLPFLLVQCAPALIEPGQLPLHSRKLNIAGAGSAGILRTGISLLNPFEDKGKLDAQPSPWVEQVGLRPRVYHFHNFLTNEERTHLIRLAAPMMKRSTVAGEKGQIMEDRIRTSHGMFIRRLQDPVVERIEYRISMATQLPMGHQEDIQVLRYAQGEQYGAHFDSSYDTKDSGPHFRMATFLMYLSDVEEGGETTFPVDSVWYDKAQGARVNPSLSPCAKNHVSAKPKAGDAVLFYSFFPNKTLDPASMHAGCPVLKGIKWSAPVWIHLDEFHSEELDRPSRPEEIPHEPGLCQDYDRNCEAWAKRGECKTNEAFMTGRMSSTIGMCRKACKLCSPCKPTDWECIHRNRKAEGFLELNREEMERLGVNWWMCNANEQL